MTETTAQLKKALRRRVADALGLAFSFGMLVAALVGIAVGVQAIEIVKGALLLGGICVVFTLGLLAYAFHQD